MMARAFWIAVLCLAAATSQAAPAAGGEEKEKLEQLSIEELMNVHVISASNTEERLADAPATVIVLSAEEIRRRGYTELSQIFDDLPGMDVVRPYGDTFFKNYWRGYRNTIGDPFLLMIDGVVFNHLYFNTADIIATFPLSNIERVEIVFGPASSVYGPNAFMGVVNVITRNDELRNGTFERISMTAGSFQTRVLDGSVSYKSGDVRIIATARIDNGVVDPSVANRYEYTKNQYFADPRLWGGFANSGLGGSFDSPHRNRAIDMRAYAGSLEAGVQYFRLDAGYGVEYAGDRSQNNAVWSRPDFSAYLRSTREIRPGIRSTTLVRYRTSGVSNDSFFTESYPGNAVDPTQRVAFSYWNSSNSSISAFQDFDVKASNRLSFRTGVRYEQKDLEKAYDTIYGPSLPASSVTDPSHYPFPAHPDSGSTANNRITTEDLGAYVQTWFRMRPGLQLNFGVRNDHNSKYGTATTVRAGSVGTLHGITLKALYGEAFEEPSNRLLYGGWDGSGSDPRLRPERSRTIEISGSKTMRNLSTLLSLWRVDNRGTFINTAHAAENLGDRQVLGFDWHLQSAVSLPRTTQQLQLFSYYSRILRADEKKLDVNGVETGTGPIGDLARQSVHAGASFSSGKLTASLRARYVGPVHTVETNPVPHIGGYATADASVRWDDLIGHGVGLSVTLQNLTDRKYDQPGVRDASAGTTPGYFDSSGLWHGSAGYYSSLLPQPGRAVLVGIHVTGR